MTGPPRYTDVEVIGEGMNGKVWLCLRPGDQSPYARKELRRDAPAALVRRFQREVRLLAELRHPNIVPILDSELETVPSWYMMPRYQQSLGDVLPAINGDELRIIQIFGRLLNAAAFAHSRDVIHRDIKPQNVLLNSDEDVVLSDFGLGRALTSVSTRQTETGFGMGTYLYMAPEQLDDAKHVDARADVYALGRVLLEMYTTSLTRVAEVDRLGKALPRDLQHIIATSIHLDPERRFRSGIEMQAAWNEWASGFNARYAERLRRDAMEMGSERALRWFVSQLVDTTVSSDTLYDYFDQPFFPLIERALAESPALLLAYLPRWLEAAGNPDYGRSRGQRHVRAVATFLFSRLRNVRGRVAIIEFLLANRTGFDPAANAQLVMQLLTELVDPADVLTMRAALAGLPEAARRAAALLMRDYPKNWAFSDLFPPRPWSRRWP